ncbi:MAG: hypothetical protein ACI4U3_01665, partial [Traorella sp.]
MKNKLREDALLWIDKHQQETIHFGEVLFDHPELGFKEYQTKSLVLEYLNQHGIQVEKEYYETGFQVTLGKGYPHIGLIAELDAIPTLSHPHADSHTHAAHSCGHSTQVAIMCSVLAALKEIDFKGRVTCFFTPAEEFCDLDYRKQLRSEGKLKALSGKTNLLLDGVFDDCDCLIHLHGMGEYRGYRYSVGSTLAGFVYKKIT